MQRRAARILTEFPVQIVQIHPFYRFRSPQKTNPGTVVAIQERLDLIGLKNVQDNSAPNKISLWLGHWKSIGYNILCRFSRSVAAFSKTNQYMYQDQKGWPTYLDPSKQLHLFKRYRTRTNKLMYDIETWVSSKKADIKQ